MKSNCEEKKQKADRAVRGLGCKKSSMGVPRDSLHEVRMVPELVHQAPSLCVPHAAGVVDGGCRNQVPARGPAQVVHVVVLHHLDVRNNKRYVLSKTS
jgi:hypothetical protein